MVAMAVARAGRAAVGAAVRRENWGLMRRFSLDDDHAHLATRPVADSLSPRSFASGAQESSGSVSDVRPSSGEAAEGEDNNVRSFYRGPGQRGSVDRVARQYVYTRHPCSRTSIRATSLTTLPHVRILVGGGGGGAAKYVFYFKEGRYHLLLVGPNSLLLPRCSIKMESAGTARAAPDPQTDPRVGLHYMRHGKEFLVGLRGSREDVQNVKSRIARFLRTELHLEVGLSSDAHIPSGASVVFLGTRIAGLLESKTRRRFSREVETRRRAKIRAQQMAKARARAWHDELRALSLQSWAFGLKRTKRELQSWEFAKQAMYKTAQGLASKFALDQMERGRDAIPSLHDEDVFFDAASTSVPEPILRAHQRLTRLMEQYIHDETTFEKKAKAIERMRPRPPQTSITPLQLLAPMEILTEKLRVKGILQPGKAMPTVLTSMLSSSDEAIVSYFAALGTCLLSYYRCCDNFQKVRRLVDYQVRWAALFTLAGKHSCSAKKIISEFSRGPRIVNRKGGVVVEFPSSPYIARMRKKFLLNVQLNSVNDILRSRRLQVLPSEAKQGPRRVHLRES